MDRQSMSGPWNLSVMSHISWGRTWTQIKKKKKTVNKSYFQQFRTFSFYFDLQQSRTEVLKDKPGDISDIAFEAQACYSLSLCATDSYSYPKVHQ